MQTDPISRAIKFCGSQGKLAAAAGVSQPAISKACRTGRVSVELAHRISRATQGRVPVEDLRPDFFPPSAGADGAFLAPGTPAPRAHPARSAQRTCRHVAGASGACTCEAGGSEVADGELARRGAVT